MKNYEKRFDAVAKPPKLHNGFEALASEDMDESHGIEEKKGEGNDESGEHAEGLRVVVEGHAQDGGGGRPPTEHG